MIEDVFPLHIFPEGGLSSSVTTTIWVGVWVLCHFNLRFGWVLSGLVVPGYLAPLVLARPWSASVILLEGFLTYFLVWLVSEPLSSLRGWSAFFGRERFMALVLCSIAVRLGFDGYLLPWLGEWANRHWHIAFDYRDNLHSYGLIIVSLVANQFWKSGFARGLVPFFSNLILTVLIVRFLLMEFTNFGFADLEYAYEDIASSIMAGPKAYIVLIATAFLASRMNLHYGWDFNGILIPSLIALQWYQPLRLLATFGESLAILLTAHLLLRLPWFAHKTIEGARKLLLFFNISFAYKLVLGHLILWLAPEWNITDFYGFGYLLATLIAIKIHDKDILARLTRATLQTSAVAVVVSSLIGFGLTLLPHPGMLVPTPGDAGARLLERPETSLAQRLNEARIELYRIRESHDFVSPGPDEYVAWQNALADLAQYLQGADSSALERAARALAAVDYRIERLAGGYLYLSQNPATPPRGWGVFAFDPGAGSLLLEVPGSLEEPDAIDAGFALFQTLHGRGLFIAGSRRRDGLSQSGNALLNRELPFHLAHRAFQRGDSLQVRAYPRESSRRGALVSALAQAGERSAEAAGERDGQAQSSLWITDSLPASLKLAALKELIGGYDLRWSAAPFANRQREASRGGFAELFLTPDGQRRLLLRTLLQHRAVPVWERQETLVGYLQDWLLATKGSIAERNSELYRPARLEELLFFDEEVLTPLLRLIPAEYADGRWSEAGQRDLRALAGNASLLGYRLIQYRHRVSGREYLLLAEQEPVQGAVEGDGATRRYWGTYVLRLGPARGYVLEVPRPLQEVNSFEFAVAWFERLQARALLIAGAHPQANADGSADLVRPGNKATLFNLVNQVLLREAGDAPMLVLQSRSFGFRSDRPPVGADVLIALASGGDSASHAIAPVRDLLADFERDAIRWQFASGSEAAMGYEVGGLTQAQYLSATRNKEFGLLWLSPLARSFYRQQDENRWQDAQFRSVAIGTRQTDLYTLLAEARWTAPPPALRARLAAYQHAPDVVRLQAAALAAAPYRLERVVDAGSKQAFLLAWDRKGALALVANLAPHRFEPVAFDPAHGYASYTRFLDSRSAWLEAPP